GGELAPALLFDAGEILVLQESRGAERFDQDSRDVADVEIAGQPYQHSSQIEIGLRPIETRERLDQQWWNNQDRIGKVAAIADQQPWVVGGGRWHEVEIQAQTWQGLGQVPMLSQAGRALFPRRRHFVAPENTRAGTATNAPPSLRRCPCAFASVRARRPWFRGRRTGRPRTARPS